MITVVCKNKEVELIPLNEKPICRTCPACQSKVERKGPMWVCTNQFCKGVSIKRIKKWIKNRRILHLGDSQLESLVASGVVTSIPDLYKLDAASLIRGGIGQGMIKHILPQIEASKICSLSDLIGCLSIDLLGRSQVKILIQNGVDTLDKWKNLTQSQIEQFPGFKSTKASRIARSLRDNWSLVEAVAACITLKTVTTATKSTSNKLAGKSICLTGSMSRSRNEIEQDILAAGGTISNNVSSSTSYLCQADPSSQSAKSKKATSLNIPVISEFQLYQMLEQSKSVIKNR